MYGQSQQQKTQTSLLGSPPMRRVGSDIRQSVLSGSIYDHKRYFGQAPQTRFQRENISPGTILHTHNLQSSAKIGCKMNGVPDLQALKLMETVLKEFRTLDCSCCNEFFGYMHRKTGALYCSSSCLTNGQKTGSDMLMKIPMSPLTPHQILKVVSHVPELESNGFHEKQSLSKNTEDRVDGSARLSALPKSVEPAKPERPEPPFTKKPAASAPVKDASEKNPFSSKMDVPKKPPQPVPEEKEENPFSTARKSEPKKTEISRASVLPVDDEEENPFKPTANKTSKVESEENPFKNPASSTRPSKPEEKKAQPTTVSQRPSRTPAVVDVEDTEENPFISAKAVKKPVPAPETETVREVEVIPDPVVIQLRSALSWSTDADSHMGRVLLGGKSNDAGPTDFYFQSVAMSNKLTALQADINAFSASAVAVRPKRLELGTLVFAPFSGDIFRGEIVGTSKPDVSEVFFIDYGNTAEIPNKEISILPKEFQDVPRLCFQCQWDFWLARDKKAKVEDSVTERYHSTESQGIIPLKKLGDGQYLVAIGQPVKNVNFTVKQFPKVDKVPVGVVEKEASPPPAKPKVQRKKYMFKDCVYSPSLKNGCIVKLGYVWGYTKFMALCEEDTKPLQELDALVNKCLDPKNQFDSRPELQEIVLAPYQGEYYRARVVELPKDENTVKVLYVDYGDVDTVKLSDIYQPSAEVMAHPIYAMNVELHGLKNETAQPKLGKEENDFLAAGLQLQIIKQPDPEGSSHIFDVTLWNGDTSLNKIMKRAFEAAAEYERALAELAEAHLSYLDKLVMYDEYSRSTIKYFEDLQTAVMVEKAVAENVPFTYNWSPKDTQFDYFFEDLPFQALKGIVNVRIVRYRRLDAITVLPLGEKYDAIRESLSKDIKEYVYSNINQWDPNFVPQRKQVCLVKIPTIKECQEIYKEVMGEKTYKHNSKKLWHPDSHQEGKWCRGLYDCLYSNKYWFFNLFDEGLELPVAKTNVYKSPLWFVIAPMQCTTLIILWLELAQLTRRMELAMNTVMIEGTFLKVEIVAEYDDLTMVRLIHPKESETIQAALIRYRAQEERLLKEKSHRKIKSYEKWLPQPETKTFEPPGLAPKRFHIEMASSEDELEEILLEENQGFNKWTKIRQQFKLKDGRLQESLYRHVTKSTK